MSQKLTAGSAGEDMESGVLTHRNTQGTTASEGSMALSSKAGYTFTTQSSLMLLCTSEMRILLTQKSAYEYL